MVLFGELVIPSSRVLWEEDEYEQFTEESQTLNWEGLKIIPTEITNLLIIETKKLSSIALSCLNKDSKPICSLTLSPVNIYKLKKDNYMIICEEGKDVIPGEVTEKLIPWLERAKKITAITSNSIAMFHKKNSEEMPISFLRSLCTGKIDDLFASKLEVPNLITGICAGAITYCQMTGKSASLYIHYSDSRPIDSITAKPVLNLLEKLNIPSEKPFHFIPTFTTDSNLYM